jgi:hypothetical protein
VTLIEQGRGLGGRVCTRRAKGVPGLTFDHGCQYLTSKTAAFTALTDELLAEGVLAPWGGVGDVSADPTTGRLDLGTFAAYPSSKRLLVGVPGNSAVGRRLAAMCGAELLAVTAARCEQLVLSPGGRWQLRLQSKAAEPGGPQGPLVAEAEARSYAAVVTAMSANSTAQLLRGVSDDMAAAAAAVDSNVCWALMLATRRRLPLPFDGALVAGGGPIAWLARDSSKPGRAAPAGALQRRLPAHGAQQLLLVAHTAACLLPPPARRSCPRRRRLALPRRAGGAGDAWVVHAAPEWSNARRGMAREQVAAELLQALCLAAGVQLGPEDLLHCEAHRWNNAYPLNPRPPVALEGHPQLQGQLMLDAGRRLAACGDWCAGPRAGDAFTSGWEAAAAVLPLL